MNSLPTELILHLSTFLPLPSLNALLQTCRALRHLLHETLYTRALTHTNTSGKSILHWSVTKNRIATARHILSRSSSPSCNVPDYSKSAHVSAALYAAVERNQIHFVSLFLTAGARASPSRSYRNWHQNGWTLLHQAAMRGHTEIVQLLLSHGARVTSLKRVNHHAYTALHLAARNGYLEILKLLLEAGGSNGLPGTKTALHEASARGERECAALLLEYGADVNGRTRAGATPLHEAAWGSRGGAEGTVELLLEKGADVRGRDVDGETPLHRCRRVGVARLLIQAQADVGALDEHQNTPLHTLADYGYVEVMGVLVENGADETRQDYRGRTPGGILRDNEEYAEALRSFIAHGGSLMGTE